jgi:hypothetical protein
MAQIGRFVAVGDSLNDASNIGYSSNGGETWTVSTETNGLFSDFCYGTAVAYGHTPDGSGVFVAGGLKDGDGGIIGYSLDGGVRWSLAANPAEVCEESFEGIATDGSGVFVAVGGADDDSKKIGFSPDGGQNWQVVANTDGLFQGGQGSQGGGIAYGYTPDGSGVFVAVGNSDDDSKKIGFSLDGGLNWQVATNTNGLFQGGRGNGIAYGVKQDGSGVFVAVGDSLDDLSNIGFSLDGGVNWQVATDTNGLFSGGAGRGIVSATVNGIGGFMAVGSSLDDLGNIGISYDGDEWFLPFDTNGLFQGGSGYGIAYDGSGTFVAVGKSTDDLSNIGYLTLAPGPFPSWTIATATDGLFMGNVSGRAIAFGYAAPPTPPNPIYNICFPAGTPIKTDQGIFPIEKLHANKHTINKQPIQHITKTVTQDTHLICFEKHALGPNVPSAPTRMTKEHKLMFEGRYVAAEKFLSLSKKVTKVKYNGELLYNVLLETYGTLQVNNLVCETLHPDNLIAKLYNNYKEAERPDLVCQLNASLLERNVKKYKAVERKILHK